MLNSVSLLANVLVYPRLNGARNSPMAEMYTDEDVTVLNRSKQLTMSGHKIVLRLTRPLTGLVLSLGLALSGVPVLPVQAAELAMSTSPASMTSDAATSGAAIAPDRFSGQSEANMLYHHTSGSPLTATTSPSVFPSNGIYLYGQLPEPDQIGTAYAVMEIVDNQAVGAFYMPQSSFDCFYGAVQPDNLALNVVSSYDQQTHQYSMPLQSTAAVATTTNATDAVQLVGYHEIATLSHDDHRLLGVCRSNVQK